MSSLRHRIFSRATDTEGRCRICTQDLWNCDHAVVVFQAEVQGLSDAVDRLEAAIARHRERVSSLGINSDGLHGGQWDRELWAALDEEPAL